MVQSYVMIRSQPHADGNYGPHEQDLAPYPINGEDVTARVAAMIATEPQVVIWRLRMSNADAVTMSADNKLWMIASQRFDPEGELVESDHDQPYTEQERATRITQLAAFTDFDADTIAAWWTPEKTRQEVAVKLRTYLRTLSA